MKHFSIDEIFEFYEGFKTLNKDENRHLEECEECRKNFEKVKFILNSFEIEVPDDVKTRVRIGIRKKILKEKRKLLVTPLLTVFLLLILVFSFFNLKQEKIQILSPLKEAVWTPDEVLFALKIDDINRYEIYLDTLNITDSMRFEGGIFYYLAENIELMPGSHYLIIRDKEKNKDIIVSRFYLTGFYPGYVMGGF